MAKLAKPKAKDKPAAPKKPSTRSKTGNAACSEAASNWQLSLRGKAALSPDTYQTLAKCRAMNRTAKMAEAQGRTGKLSAMGESAVKARLQARFDSGLITQKARTEKLDMLLKQRSERGKVATPKLAPAATLPQRPGFLFDPGKSKAQTIVDSARSNPKYQQNRLRAKVNQNRVKSEIESNPTSMGVFRGSQRSKNAVYSGELGLNSRKQREARLSGTKKELAEKRSERDYYANATPTPAPTPARYGLGGHLAPGRGTEERKAEAAFRLAVRSGDAKKIAASGNKRGKLQGSKVKYRDTSWSDSTTQIRQVSVGRNQSTATRVNVEDLQIEIRNRTRYRQKTGKLTIQPKPIPIVATFDASTTVDRNGREIRGYVARLTGTDPKYKLKREFINVPTGGILTTSERGLYESRGPSASVFGIDRANKPTEKNYVLIGRRKVRNLVDFQAERAVRLMERFRGTPLPYTTTPPAAPKNNGESISPKPAARYSLGGKLAPGRGTEKRKNRVSLKIYERSERNAQRAYAAGAIPLSDKKRIGADENFVATIFQSETGGPGRQRFAKAVKTVSGADRAAVQIESVKEGGKYGVIDPVSGFGAGLNYKKQADAKSVAIRMDRLTKRASREQGGGILSLNDVASGKGGSRYQELLKSVVRRELRRSGQSGRASRIR